MESSQKIATFADISGEINNGKTAYIRPIGHGLCTFIAYN